MSIEPYRRRPRGASMAASALVTGPDRGRCLVGERARKSDRAAIAAARRANEIVDPLDALASDAMRVVREVGTDGKLGGQADVKGVAGTRADKTNSGDFTAGNLDHQVRSGADVTTGVGVAEGYRRPAVAVERDLAGDESAADAVADVLGSLRRKGRSARIVGAV
jgi:hypothetical protein